MKGCILLCAAPPPVEPVVNSCVCAPALFIVIPVVDEFILLHVSEPAESAAKPGGLPPLLLKSSLMVVCVCVCPGSVIE